MQYGRSHLRGKSENGRRGGGELRGVSQEFQEKILQAQSNPGWKECWRSNDSVQIHLEEERRGSEPLSILELLRNKHPKFQPNYWNMSALHTWEVPNCPQSPSGDPEFQNRNIFKLQTQASVFNWWTPGLVVNYFQLNPACYLSFLCYPLYGLSMFLSVVLAAWRLAEMPWNTV